MARRTFLPPRLALLAVVLAAALVWLFAAGPTLPIHAHALQVDPYGAPGLERYRQHRDALDAGDLAALSELAAGDDYLALRAARSLAAHEDADPALRLGALERVLVLRLEEPLARRTLRELQLRVGRVAEAAGRPARAMEAYREALPLEEAIRALERLEQNRYELANAYLQANLHRRALEALGELAAPSIEAPSHRALGDHETALEAYRRWLAQQPGAREAQLGVAWSQWQLGRLDDAEAAFAGISGSEALYGRALIANRRGQLERAVRLLRESGDPRHLWLATTLLERAGDDAAAMGVYLDLAHGDSSYADDAAYRAHLLAAEVGDERAAAEARALVPGNSFFGLLLGKQLALPTRNDLPVASPPALEVARALMIAHDPEAAAGELAFALRAAQDEAEQVALGEALQQLDRYRQPQRVGDALIQAGSRQLRTWRLAYPKAWDGRVRVEAKGAGVEPELVWAVMRRESAFYPPAVSHSGAQGLMQVMPTTWDWIAELLEEPPADPYVVPANIRYGVHYLGWLRNYFDGDLELMIASYNRGQGYVRRLFEGPEVQGDKAELYRRIDAFETREYLQNVMLTYRLYQALGEVEAQLGDVSPEQAAAPAAR